MKRKTFASSASRATRRGISSSESPGSEPTSPSGCSHDNTRLDWVTVPHPSGSPHLPGRERLAKVCQACGKVVCFSHSIHTDLVLGLYKPPERSPKP